MENKKTLLQMNNASFRYPTGDYLFEHIKLSIQEEDKIALVGVNGSGKSTLFKILNEKLTLEEGTLVCNQPAYYVPQIDITLRHKHLKLFEYIEKQYESWWEILEEIETLFGTTLEPDAELNTLSGGELIKINLAIAVRHKPEILLLDEPTNHIDIKSVQALINFLKNVRSAYVIVSHDTFFLDQVVTTVWELENKKVITYGGNHTFYKEQKALHKRGVEKKFELAKDKLERAKSLAQKEEERRARKANTAKLALIKGSMDITEYHEGKMTSSASMKGSTTILEKLKDQAEQELEQYQTEDRHLAFITMKNTSNSFGRAMITVENAKLTVKGKALINDINFKIVYGDRIVITGDNGVGKTSLIKAVLSKTPNINIEGKITTNSGLTSVYVDQAYSIIQPDLNLIDNIMEFDKTVSESKAKEQLGKFQFKTESEMKRKGQELSGGEMARLMMAMVSSYPIDILVLDEPTNNLDVETIEVLEKALNSYTGALIIISHNIDFLNKINIKTAYIIRKKKFKLMENTPKNKDDFYKELLKE